MKHIILAVLRFYQRVLSPDRGFLRYLFPTTRGYCRMQPSCSEYMILSVEKFGVLRGVFRGIIRILRCNPWQKNLIDFP